MNNYYGYNGYPQYPQGYQSNMQRQGQMYNAPMAQPQPMPMQPQQPMQYDMPINYVGYTNLKEAEGHILFPNQKAIFIDKANGMVYEKICGNDGLSSMTHYKRVEAQGENQAVEPQKQEPTIDLSNYVKTTDLDTFKQATIENIKNMGFVSKEEYDKLAEKVEKLASFTKPTTILGGKANVGTINQ